MRIEGIDIPEENLDVEYYEFMRRLELTIPQTDRQVFLRWVGERGNRASRCLGRAETGSWPSRQQESMLSRLMDSVRTMMDRGMMSPEDGHAAVTDALNRHNTEANIRAINGPQNSTEGIDEINSDLDGLNRFRSMSLDDFRSTQPARNMADNSPMRLTNIREPDRPAETPRQTIMSLTDQLTRDAEEPYDNDAVIGLDIAGPSGRYLNNNSGVIGVDQGSVSVSIKPRDLYDPGELVDLIKKTHKTIGAGIPVRIPTKEGLTFSCKFLGAASQPALAGVSPDGGLYLIKSVDFIYTVHCDLDHGWTLQNLLSCFSTQVEILGLKYSLPLMNNFVYTNFRVTVSDQGVSPRHIFVRLSGTIPTGQALATGFEWLYLRLKAKENTVDGRSRKANFGYTKGRLQT